MPLAATVDFEMFGRCSSMRCAAATPAGSRRPGFDVVPIG
jgi:hypothetical protein